MIKGTSLAFTLGVTELMGAAQKEAAGSFLYFEAFLVVAAIYWIMVEALSFGQRRLEDLSEQGACTMTPHPESSVQALWRHARSARTFRSISRRANGSS